MYPLKTILFVGFFTISCSAFSQTQDLVLAKAYYAMRHKRDTIKKDSVYSENTVLMIGKNVSVFKSLDRQLQAERVKEDQDRQEKNFSGPGKRLFKKLPDLRKISTEEFHIFQADKKLFVKEYLMQNYLYSEALEEIKWNLETDTKIIGKAICQKATSNYKGRNWVVWFAPDIPFETGPWKLYGLPGLILEAHDVKNEVQFVFTGFEPVNPEENLKITLPKDVIKVSLSDIKKLKDLMYKNPKGFFQAQIHARRGIIDSKEHAGFSFQKVNNPIDLNENK